MSYLTISVCQISFIQLMYRSETQPEIDQFFARYSAYSCPTARYEGTKKSFITVFSVRCVHTTNRRSIATMFVRLPVCLSATGVHCDHTVHFSADFRLRLDIPMFCSWHPDSWHQSISGYSQPSFSVSLGREVGYGVVGPRSSRYRALNLAYVISFLLLDTKCCSLLSVSRQLSDVGCGWIIHSYVWLNLLMNLRDI